MNSIHFRVFMLKTSFRTIHLNLTSSSIRFKKESYYIYNHFRDLKFPFLRKCYCTRLVLMLKSDSSSPVAAL